jgi:hypothetical protein
MAIEEPGVRLRLHRTLEDLVGAEEADLLMDRPLGGWGALVTKEHLALELGALHTEMDARFESLEARFDARFEQVDARFESLEARFDARFEQVDARLRGMDERVDSRINKAFAAQTWRIGGFMLGIGGLIVAALRV